MKTCRISVKGFSKLWERSAVLLSEDDLTLGFTGAHVVGNTRIVHAAKHACYTVFESVCAALSTNMRKAAWEHVKTALKQFKGTNSPWW